MDIIQNFPFFTIIAMLSCGVVCSVLKPKAAKWYCLFWLTVSFVLTVFVVAYVARTGQAYTYMLGRWSAPWGNEIRIGLLEAVLAMTFLLVMLLSLLGGMEHIFEDVEPTKVNLYFTMSGLLMTSLLVLIYTNDMFTAFVFVEINTIGSCALVMLRYKAGKTLVATTKYMIMSLLGSGLFLLGICILYNITGQLLMIPLGESIRELYNNSEFLYPLAIAIVFFGIGLSIKSALFPFHTWLPDAHGSATAASSAILSGLVLKGYIFLMIKIFYRVIGLHVIRVSNITDILFVFGVGAMIIGSIRALGQKDIKRMLAYSSVAQIGYIFVGIGMGTQAGFAAACIQMLVHAVTKPMLFCCAGGFMSVSGGSRQMKDLNGAGWRDPLGGIAFLVGSLSMIGIPFFAGFVTKIYLTSAVIQGSPLRLGIGVAAIALSTLLNALYYIPTVANLFSARKDMSPYADCRAKYRPEYVIAMVIFILCNFVIGIGGNTVVNAVYSGLGMLGL